jgi:hypothetical protein
VLVVNPVPSSWIDLIYNAKITSSFALAIVSARVGSAAYRCVDVRAIRDGETASDAADYLFEAAVTWVDKNGRTGDVCIEAFSLVAGKATSAGRKCNRISTKEQE